MFARAILLAGLSLLAALPSHAADLFATTTTYEIFGSTALLDMESPFAGVLDPYTIHSDAVARQQGRYLYIVNRLFADNVLVLDAADSYSVVTQFSVASAGLNPRDIEAITPDRAYVTLYESNSILICNPLTGAMLGSIDLSAFADDDGLCEMDQMARVGDRVFVAVQAMERRTSPWSTTGSSGLVVIDTATDAVVDVDPLTPELDAIALTGQNPYWRMHFDGRLGRLLLITSGSFQLRDGGLEVVNPFSLESEGFLIDESDLGAELLDFAVVDDARGWALTNDAQFNTCLVAFDPSTGSVAPPIYCTNGFHLSDLELSLDGRLFVSDRTPSNPGVRVFDAADGAALAGPISTGLPPFDLVLVEGTATQAPPVIAGARLFATPTPFNPRVELQLVDWPDGRATPPVDVFDARGRRVVTLRGSEGGNGPRYEWDGRDERGVESASGTYHARVRAASGPARSLVLVR